MRPGDGGPMSNVANAGALVSPALISPTRPPELLRARGLSLSLLSPESDANLRLEVVAKAEGAPVLAASILMRYGGADGRQ